MFVQAVPIGAGPVKRGQQILKLDARRLEKDLARWVAFAELLKIKADRLSDDYLEEYVFGPLREDRQVKIEKRTALALASEQTKDRRSVGTVTSVDVLSADASLAAGEADVAATRAEIAAHMITVRKQRMIQVASERNVQEHIETIKVRISLTTVLSPWDALAKPLTTGGLFVEKGDPLIELTRP